VTDAQVECCCTLPTKATSTPAIAKYVLLPNSSVVEPEGVTRLLITVFAKDVAAHSQHLLPFWLECVFAFKPVASYQDHL
jgi:hypothetical protein